MADRYDTERERDRERERGRYDFDRGREGRGWTARGEWERDREWRERSPGGPGAGRDWDTEREWAGRRYEDRSDWDRESGWAGDRTAGRGEWQREDDRYGDRRWRASDGRPGSSGAQWGGAGLGSYTGGMGGYDERGQYSGRGPKGYKRSDDRIREDVCERLTRHPDIDASEVEVQVQDGEVTLSGSVDDRHMKRMAEDIAEDVSGVRDVHNHLRAQRHSILER